MKKWPQFITESRFLKNTDLIGYIDLSYYPELRYYFKNFELAQSYGINKIWGTTAPLEKDFLRENDKVIWNYSNEILTNKINEVMFKKETESTFDLSYLEFTREPIEVASFSFNQFTDKRVNHYMLKNNDESTFSFGDFEEDSEITKFVNLCVDECKRLNLDWQNRWCYLTIDQMLVEKGKSQREFGWHIDGMQGDEVAQKVPADFQFIWADATPTKFCTKTFNIEGLDPSKHNVFNWLGRQTEERFCYTLDKFKIYLMNAYHVHSATISDIVQYRRFVRLSFTNTPITSVKMTVNPAIKYNYQIHKTTGNIPKNLI